jgi:hypothetical protein
MKIYIGRIEVIRCWNAQTKGALSTNKIDRTIQELAA